MLLLSFLRSLFHAGLLSPATTALLLRRICLHLDALDAVQLALDLLSTAAAPTVAQTAPKASPTFAPSKKRKKVDAAAVDDGLDEELPSEYE